MSSKAIVWIREDFRIHHNQALSYAARNHDQVTTLYIYNPKHFVGKREAQQWWLFKSLESFSEDLAQLNINLEIQQGDEIEILSKIKKSDEVTIYWNKVYEPGIIEMGKKIRDNFVKKDIQYKYFKGNTLNEFQDVKKNDGTPFKVFTPFWRNAEQVYLNSVPSKISKIQKLSKNFSYFKKNIKPNEVLPKKKWYKKFELYWKVSETESHKYLKDLINNKIKN